MAEKLTEKQVLAQAKKEGIEFIDYYQVEGKSEHYDTREEAEKEAGDKPVMQVRTRKEW